ncbi:DUF305 domain-containing protein [Streptomyces sp. NPDC048845]|uniref:DUF305 domain-containing protein n=1 Tax=Streptomyces sp. NPDC048845 TaxID=3155390 RepID=UPI003445EBB9
MNTTPHRGMPRRPLSRRTALAAGAALSAVLLTACGAGDDGSGRPSADSGASATAGNGTHNAADVAFAQGMIPHHRQAVAMSENAAGKAASPEVEDLAAEIGKAQAPEIETMSGWLESWGEKVPEGMGGTAENGHGAHRGHDPAMPGMMDDRQLKELNGASGKDFDTLFLTMMIEHHEGAVKMAETELKQGAYRPARDLAAEIVKAQTGEIKRMKQLLDPA